MSIVHSIVWLAPLVTLCLSFSESNDTAQRLPVADRPTAFYELLADGNYVLRTCAFVFGQQMTFDNVAGKCVPQEHIRNKRQAIGVVCSQSIDCGGNGMYCTSIRRCACLSTFIADGTVCRPKINPGQTGCVTSVQCTSVTAESYCDSGSGGTGTCRCTNQRDPIRTSDGYACVFAGQCPTNGDAPKYVNADGTVKSCALSAMLCPPAYDCICTTAACTTTEAKFCCPTRGLACIQNYDEGMGQQVVQRWYHNPATSSCQRFNYRGTGGNANNFQSQAECETYCLNNCRRGNSELIAQIGTPESNVLFTTSARTCTTDSDCVDSSLNLCDMLGTNSYCCPRPAYICSRRGGISDYAARQYEIAANADGPIATTYDPGTRNINRPTTQVRYYYDIDQRRCLNFTYMGQGGNMNNFITQSHCDRYCAQTVCAAGEPLKDASGINNLQCTSSSNCPSSYTCSSTVCCPNAQAVCSLPQAVGSCPNTVEKWWYNAATTNCERFLYSGCMGNANNFDTQLQCQNFCRDTSVQPQCPQGVALRDSFDKYIVCGGTSLTTTCPGNYYCYFDGSTYGCCPTKAFTCSQSFDQGSQCSPRVTRWYYEMSQRRCLNFDYYGCDGNSNNFGTQQDCQDYCGVGGCPDGGEPYREPGTGTYRQCIGGAACPSTHYCSPVALGSSVTYNYCCPSKAFVCSLPRDSGSSCSQTTLTRYFFNSVTRNCEAFAYNGCGGNRNSFSTAAVCLNYCNSAGCPPGTIALRDPLGTTLTTCTVGTQSNSCPSQYTCVQSTVLGQAICCGVPQSLGKCPAGQSSYYDTFSNTDLQCQPNTPNACPFGYMCLYSSTSASYYCCGSAVTQCPQGGTVLIEPVSNVARQCTPGVTGVCPTSYTCQPSNINIQNVLSTTGYCCGSAFAGVCGAGANPLLQNNIPVVCMPGQTACQSGYECVFSSANSQYFCCTPTVTAVAQVCGAGQPYIVQNAPVVCTQNSPNTGCPPSFTCTYYASANAFYCCQSGGTGTGPVITTNSDCPPNFAPVFANNIAGQYRYCSPNDPVSCSIGNCFWSNAMQRFICCSSATSTGVGVVQPSASNVCPTGLEPLINPSANAPQTCMLGQVNCPATYTCTLSNNIYYCCRQIGTPTTTGALCPAGLQVLLVSGQPQFCNPQAPTCASPGYQCLTTADGRAYCCGSATSTGAGTGCPNNGAVQMVGPTPVMCTPGAALSGCSFGYSCTYNAVYNRNVCCTNSIASGGDQYGCPQGSAYLYPNTQMPLVCQPSGSACPSGYQCVMSTRLSGYMCCGGSLTGGTGVVSPVSSGILSPGDSGCVTDSQCQGSGEPNARCQNGQCLCSSFLLVYSRRCVGSCPWPYRNINGICITSTS